MIDDENILEHFGVKGMKWKKNVSVLEAQPGFLEAHSIGSSHLQGKHGQLAMKTVAALVENHPLARQARAVVGEILRNQGR